MTDRPLSGAQVLDHAVFALEMASRTQSPDLALIAIRNALQDLDARDAGRVAACLALHAVKGRPAAEVAAWVETLSLEHLVMLESAKGPDAGEAER